VIPAKTGFLLPPNPDPFVRTMRELDESALRSMKGDCIARARVFDEAVFVEKMKGLAAGAA
jgi:hypothetical protein